MVGYIPYGLLWLPMIVYACLCLPMAPYNCLYPIAPIAKKKNELLKAIENFDLPKNFCIFAFTFRQRETML